MCRESATCRCSKCGQQFKTLADEYMDHPCPRCGYHPSQEADFCTVCGASIPHRKGEGTCPACDPPEQREYPSADAGD
jgi:Zn finger protein HypA/HybF involved in hydrogenase expression